MWVCKNCTSMNANDQSRFCPKCGNSRKDDDTIQISAICHARQKWQYKVITVDCGVGMSIGGKHEITRQNLDTALAREGLDCWELVSVITNADLIGQLLVTFKRPIE